jgi:hypothetical protein
MPTSNPVAGYDCTAIGRTDRAGLQSIARQAGTIAKMTRSNVSRTSRAKVGGKAPLEPCVCCGIAPDPRGRPFSITFEQPDVIEQIEPELLDTWGGDPFLAIKNLGFFLRVILPVKLSDGFAIDFGTWLEIDNEDFRTAWQTWNFPEYKNLEIEGYVANEIEPFGKFPHALVKATVRELEQVPYLTSSDNEVFTKLLSETWPHAEVLPHYADLLKSEPPLPG